MIKAEWSGSYPNLCRGEWTIWVDGKDVSEKIPKNLRKDCMNTYGIYQYWYFDEKGNEIFEDYEDGLKCEEWIEKNKYWLAGISADHSVPLAIFHAVNAADWRGGSCGGCI